MTARVDDRGDFFWPRQPAFWHVLLRWLCIRRHKRLPRRPLASLYCAGAVSVIVLAALGRQLSSDAWVDVDGRGSSSARRAFKEVAFRRARWCTPSMLNAQPALDVSLPSSGSHVEWTLSKRQRALDSTDKSSLQLQWAQARQQSMQMGLIDNRPPKLYTSSEKPKGSELVVQEC